MARGLIPRANELVCAPGTRVRVERAQYEPRNFEDTVSCIHIEISEDKWSALYFFTNEDDPAEPHEIKEIIAAPRTYNPIPTPKYEIGDVLEYVHSWGKDHQPMLDKVTGIEIIWQEESAVRYMVPPGYDRDWADEEDVKARYIKENTCTEQSPTNDLGKSLPPVWPQS